MRRAAALTDSTITHNQLSGTPSVTLQGEGLAATNHTVTLTHSRIANNSPDQCDGC